MSSGDGFEGEALGRIDDIVGRAVEQGQVPGVVAAVARGKTVHVADHGVRRSIWARIMPSRKSAACLGKSIARNSTWSGLINMSMWLPRSAACHSGVRAGTGRPCTRRNEVCCSTAPFPIDVSRAVKLCPSPSTNRMRRCGTIRTATVDRELATFGPPQPGSTPDPDTWLARLGELPLLAQPGDRWLYQTGSQVLGVLVSRLAGAPFDEVLRERLLGPLAMDDTGFHAADTSRLATAYEKRDGRLEVSDAPDGQWSRPPVFPDGGGGLVSSVDDVVAFGRMLLRGGGDVLTPATVAEMTRDQLIFLSIEYQRRS